MPGICFKTKAEGMGRTEETNMAKCRSHRNWETGTSGLTELSTSVHLKMFIIKHFKRSNLHNLLKITTK